jgi:hypothetical protein
VTSGDRGSASVWLLCAGLVVLSFGLTGALAAAAATGRHRAQAAADLGALAGARYAVDGEPQPAPGRPRSSPRTVPGWPAAGSTASTWS